MASSPPQNSFQPLSAQLSLDAHQTAPQGIKTFFKLHTSQSTVSDQALLELSDPGVVRIADISVPQKTKAFAAVGIVSNDALEAQQCYSISQIPGMQM